jgi:hypothetical protein
VAIEYHFDLYPSDDPRDGTRLVRYSADTALQAADYRDVIGVGSGKAIIGADLADDLDPAGEQYVRVVRDDGSTELVVGGWWTNSIRYEAAVKDETRRLEVGGAATMAYLARSVMAPHTYMGAAGAGAGITTGAQDPFDRIWRLWNQGDWAGGDYLGAILWRVIMEAQSFRSGAYTHRHKDGEFYTDTHANDRLRTAIPDLVLGFDKDDDSDGNAWTMASGQFTAMVGENVLQVVRRLMESGLFIEMDPDTFELRAWEGRPASRNGRSGDRTGSSWATGTVRLQAPTDGTIATGNIKSDSERLITSHIRRTTIWTGGGDDLYGIADTPGARPWEGFVPSDASDVAVLDNLADVQLTARDEAGDVLTARLKLGASQSLGQYRPWEEVRLDDLVTVHTGTGEWDYDEATYPVGALRIHLRDGGDWDAWVDLGASYEAMAQRQFEVAAAPAHTHPPNPELCRPMSVTEATVLRRYTSLSDVMAASVADDAAWDAVAGLGTAEYELTETPTSTRNSGVQTTDRNDVIFGQFAFELDADSAAIIADGGATVRGQFRTHMRAGIGVDDGAQDGLSQMGVRVTAGDSTTIRGTALALHNLSTLAGSTPVPRGTTYRNTVFPPAAATNVLTAVPAAVAGDFLLIEVGIRNLTPNPPAATGAHIWFNDSAASSGDLPNDEVTTTNLRSWIEISSSGVAGAGDGHIDLVGTSVRASRCDHRHDVHRDRAPTVNDNSSLGYNLGTIWAQLDDLTTPTQILGVWMLVDADAGTWLSITSSGSSGAETLDDLTDVALDTPVENDELRFDGENWINDPRKWEAVTDGEDIFVWESDDLVHEWNEAP